jgi:hypothetical protein
LASAGETCTLAVTLTQVAGGYGASTSGCRSTELRSVAAWSGNADAISLRDAGGVVLATLDADSAGGFTGTLGGTGRFLTVFRL